MGLLFVAVVPMFAFFKEMAILIPLNIGIIGIVLLTVYFLLSFTYVKFGKSIFLALLLLVSLTPPSLFFYKEWKEKHEFEKWRDFSNAIPITVNRAITEADGPDHSEQWDKYSFEIPYDGQIEAASDRFVMELGLAIFDSNRNQVEQINADGKSLFVEDVKRGEIYYLLIDRTMVDEKGYSVQLNVIEEKKQ